MNGKNLLRACLSSVLKETINTDFEVIVVDNASTDGTLEMLKNEFSRVNVISNTENMGFAAANNIGIRQANGRYILLLNPDTEILNGAIQETVAFMDKHPQAGIVGCKLIFPSGQIQTSLRSFPTIRNLLIETFFLEKIFPKTFGKHFYLDFDHNSDKQVDWVSGAYFLIRREVIEKIGLLDEQFYMYSEEMDYCYRAKQAGYEIWFTNRGNVIHHWGGMSAINKRVAVWIQRSQLLFYQKYYNGLKKCSFIFIKYVNLIIRSICYFFCGIILSNKGLINKSMYSIYAVYRLITARWKYNHNFNGKIDPWEPY